MSQKSQINVRISQEIKDRLAATAKTVGLNESDLAKACIVATIEYIEAHGEIRLPLRVIPRNANSYEAFIQAAEKPTAQPAATPQTAKTSPPKKSIRFAPRKKKA